MIEGFVGKEIQGAQAKLDRHERILRESVAATLAGETIAGTMVGAAEFVPEGTAKGLLLLGAIGIGFLTAVGPGLNALDIRVNQIPTDQHNLDLIQNGVARG